MIRREAIATLVGALGIKTTDTDLQELNPNGVFVLTVPQERLPQCLKYVDTTWQELWKHTPKNKRPPLAVIDDKTQLVNLKDIL